MGFFDRFLSLWVALAIAVGVAFGLLLPSAAEAIGSLEYAQVNIPVAILIWLMIFPMMLKIDFASIKAVGRRPKGLAITLVVNWLIKPFTMYGIAYLFFYGIFGSLIGPDLGGEYLAGAVLLGAAPCTAMVFVWSQLTKGDSAYTLVQVAINDLVLMVAYAPIVMGLLSLGQIAVPADTVILSVVLFVVLPLALAWLIRSLVVRAKGTDWFVQKLVKPLSTLTPTGLLLTLVLIFSLQAQTIVGNLLHIVLIAVPLVIQTFLIFAIGFGWARLWKVPHCIAAPAGMIGASNFFELAVAVAIAVFGVNSGATLATIVGVLVEVPVMLILVRIANRQAKKWPAVAIKDAPGN